MTQEDARQFQLERANLIDQVSTARLILAAVEGRLLAEECMGERSDSGSKLRRRINALLMSDLFGEVPEEARP
jgi:hypothetical protein